jgi:hypothetical protein
MTKDRFRNLPMDAYGGLWDFKVMSLGLKNGS